MIYLLIVLLVIAVSASGYFYLQASKLEKGRVGQDGPRGLLTTDKEHHELEDDDPRKLLKLGIGDIVSHYEFDFEVQGRIDYDEDGWQWVEFMLVDGDVQRWLSVEDDDQLEVSLWTDLDDKPFSGLEPPEFIDYQGDRFKMVEAGRAKASQLGKTGRKSGLSVEFYEYKGPGGTMLAVERWAGEIEVSLGQEANPVEFDVLPASSMA